MARFKKKDKYLLHRNFANVQMMSTEVIEWLQESIWTHGICNLLSVLLEVKRLLRIACS